MKHGLKPRIKDTRDFNLGAIFVVPNDVVDEYFNVPFSLKNQVADGNDDYCASCAGAGAMEEKEQAELFYPFLFAAAKFESGTNPDDWGLQIRDIGKAAVKWGIPEVKDVPDEIKNLSPDKRRRFENYPESVRQVALKHKQKSYFFIDGADPYNMARAAIWKFKNEKRHIVFGVEFGWPIEEEKLTGTPSGYGHAMWQNGWNLNGVYAVNSAGKNAGKNGVHQISKDTFNFYAKQYGLLMFVDMDKEDAKYLLENGIKLEDNWVVSFWKVLITIIKKIFHVA